MLIESTYCPICRAIKQVTISGKCKDCKTMLDGAWDLNGGPWQNTD